MKTTDRVFHGYTIRIQVGPPFKALVFHRTYEGRRVLIEGSSSVKDAEERSRDWIRSYHEARDWVDDDEVCVVFNVNFINDVMGGERDFSFEFRDRHLVFSPGFGLRYRCHDKSSHAQVLNASGAIVPPKVLGSLGIMPNCRYVLDDVGGGLYGFIFDSLVYSSSEKIRLHEPGFTTAAMRK